MCSVSYVRSSTPKSDAKNDTKNDVKSNAKTDCSPHKTCRSCTTNTQCSWSLERQSCVDTERDSGNLVVRVEAHCPRFTVVHKSAVGESYEHRIKVNGLQILNGLS